MAYAETLQALIAEKKMEIARLEAEISAARAFVDTLESRVESSAAGMSRGSDASNDSGVPGNEDPVVLVRRILIQARRPLFIDEIVRGLGRQVSRESREEVRQVLLPWVRRREIFNRPRPAIYGLLEFEEQH